MATTTEASAKTAQMMPTTMVIESVVLSGEAELVEADATGLALATGVAIPTLRDVDRDMIFCRSRGWWKRISELCREKTMI